jgi:hypothetical protein
VVGEQHDLPNRVLNFCCRHFLFYSL